MKKLILLLILFLPFFTFSQQEENVEITSKNSLTANYNDVSTKAINGKINSYITQSGEKFSVGDTIILGSPFNRDVYSFINQNAAIQAYPLESRAVGSRIRIKSMNAITKKLQVMCTHADGYTYQTFIMNFEMAYQNGEVLSNQISSDEALNELKKCKDKLDLGIITEEEYNLKKQELIKFIK